MHHDPNDFIEAELDNRLLALESAFNADVLAFVGPIVTGVDLAFRDAIESLQEKRQKLVVIVETDGGYIEITSRIADTLRHHYRHIDFIVPNHAMSAGTVLVLSGDAIHMDYFAVLGPIDPQIERSDGHGLMPALGYLKQFDRLIQKSADSELSDAELAYLLRRFDPAELYQYEQEREHSIALLEEWLAKYKFKDWDETETRRVTVTQEMRKERAKEIAEKLNNPELWHSHGRGISMEVLRRTLNLKIEDFGENPAHNGPILAYYRMLLNYMEVKSCRCLVHVRERYRPLMG